MNVYRLPAAPGETVRIVATGAASISFGGPDVTTAEGAMLLPAGTVESVRIPEGATHYAVSHEEHGTVQVTVTP